MDNKNRIEQKLAEWKKIDFNSLPEKEGIKFLIGQNEFNLETAELMIIEGNHMLKKFGLNPIKLIARKQFYRQNRLPIEINNLIEEKYREDLKEWNLNLKIKELRDIIKRQEREYLRNFLEIGNCKYSIKEYQEELKELEVKEQKEELEDYLDNKELPNPYLKKDLPVINKELPELPQSKLKQLESQIKKLTNKVIQKVKKEKHFIAQIQVITTRN